MRPGDLRAGARRIAAVLALGAFVGCVAAVEYEPREGPVVLPAGSGSFFVFDADRVARRGEGGVEWEETHADRGDPTAAGVDLSSAWASVSYPARVAFVQLPTRKVSWVDNPLAAVGGGARGLAIRGESVALWSGTRVTSLRVPTGEILWSGDVAALLEQSDVSHLAYALPESDDQLVLLGARVGGAMVDGKVVAQRVDRSRGDWRVRNQTVLPGMTWVHRATSDGEAVYAAGLWEDTQLRPGTTGRLWQKLLVCRVELDSLEVTELVFAERQARSTRVRDFVVGADALAVLLDEGTVQIYRIVEGGGAAAPLFERHYERVDSIAWVSDEELVVMLPSGPETVRY